MNEIFEYTDYRQWIRATVEDLKARRSIFTWRYLANKTGLDAGFLLRIAQGKAHLALDKIGILASTLKLVGREAEYFQEMVRFGRSRTDKESLERFERMQTIKELQFLTVDERQLEFHQSWYHNAIRSLVSIHPVADDHEVLASLCSPAITAEQARHSLELQHSLGLLVRGEDGFWKVTETFLRAGIRWGSDAVRNFQIQTMDLAREAMDRHPPEVRDISTVTMTLKRSNLPFLQATIREFRSTLLRLSQEGTGDDAVFQLNIQLFPIALVPARSSRAECSTASPVNTPPVEGP